MRKKEERYQGKPVGSTRELMAFRESRQNCRRALKLGDMIKFNALERKTREEGR